MSWHEMFPGSLGNALRAVIVRALVDVYDENVRRHAPDDLGDNNITFGVNVSQNLRHVIERDTADFIEIEADRPRNSFVLRVGTRSTLHFYKAPPGIIDIRALTFDESEMKLELRRDNANQLSLFGPLDQRVSNVTLPSHIVIVHFGDPQTGFHHAVAGAPYSTATGHCDWLWNERFDIGDEFFDATSFEPNEPKPKPEPGFGLEMRDEVDDAAEDVDDETRDEP